MSFQIVVSAEALESMDEQVTWYESNLPDGDDLGEKWLAELTHALNVLRDYPERYGLAHEFAEIAKAQPVRRMLFRPWSSGVGWRILFSVDETTQVVTILQVRHEHRR